MTKKMQYLRTAAVALLVAGCTTFTARQVNWDPSNPPGYFIPQQVPLLVVHNGQVSIIMACNQHRGQAIQFGAFLAKHDVEVKYRENCGGIESLKSNQDATAIPLKLIETIGSLAEHVLPAGKGLSGTEEGSTSLQVYRIEFRDGEVFALHPLIASDTLLQLRYEQVPVAGNVPVTSVNSKAPAPKGK